MNSRLNRSSLLQRSFLAIAVCFCGRQLPAANPDAALVWTLPLPEVSIQNERLDRAVARIWTTFRNTYPAESRLRGIIVATTTAELPTVTLELRDVPLGIALRTLAATVLCEVEIRGEIAAIVSMSQFDEKPIVSAVELPLPPFSPPFKNNTDLGQFLTTIGIQIAKVESADFVPERRLIIFKGAAREVKLAEAFFELLKRTHGDRWFRSPE